MDILNFISWIKSSNYRTTLPTDVQSLLVIGAKDPSRDDGYLSLAINTAPLQAVYDSANVTQLTAITTAVTVNAHNGIITTVSSTLAGGSNAAFTVNNSKVTTASKILLTVNHPGAGIPVLITEAVANGSFAIRIYNVSAADDLNRLDTLVCGARYDPPPDNADRISSNPTNILYCQGKLFPLFPYSLVFPIDMINMFLLM